MLYTSRAALVVVLVVGIALLLPPQTADMLVELTDSPSVLTGPAAAFQAALFLLAVSIWFWSRAVLAARFESEDTTASRNEIVGVVKAQGIALHRGALEWTPRLLFFAVVLVGIAIAFRNGAWIHMLYVAIWGAIGLLFVQYRLSIRERIFGTKASISGNMSQPDERHRSTTNALEWLRRIRHRLPLLLRYAPYGRWVAAAWLIVGLVFFVTGPRSPLRQKCTGRPRFGSDDVCQVPAP